MGHAELLEARVVIGVHQRAVADDIAAVANGVCLNGAFDGIQEFAHSQIAEAMANAIDAKFIGALYCVVESVICDDRIDFEVGLVALRVNVQSVM